MLEKPCATVLPTKVVSGELLYPCMKVTTSPRFHAATCALSTPRIAASSGAPACAMPPQVKVTRSRASVRQRYRFVCIATPLFCCGVADLLFTAFDAGGLSIQAQRRMPMMPQYAKYAVTMTSAAVTAMENQRTLLRTGCLRASHSTPALANEAPAKISVQM